jgi:MoaA/NifB/PqqE/SkfB family radical SAM enzyme
MTYHVLKDPKTGTVIHSHFDKVFRNDEYEVFFNSKTGLEVTRGVSGKPDPLMTELPLLLDIGIMGSCENKCSFCYQGDGDEPNMTLENFKIIIDQTKYHVNQIALGGRGDPNKHEHFKEILTYAKDNNVVPSYTTSGIDLTDEEIEISKICGAVAVSDYGTPATYEAIQRFLNAGIKTNIHLIFSSASYQKCIKILYGSNPWIEQTNEKLPMFDIEKLNGVVFLLFKPQGRGASTPDLAPTHYQLEVIAEKVLSESPNIKFKIGIDSCLANHLYKFGNVNEIHDLVIDSCEAGRMSAYITPSMQMMPCSYADKSLAIPITQEKDISYIWNRSTSFKKFRTILKKKPFSCPAGF